MSWTRVIGQERVKQFFRASIGRGRLAPAYLFTGPPGTGKFAAALELAKIVNCERGTDEVCDECRSCSMMNALQHPNLSLVFPLPVGKNEVTGDLPMAKLTEEDLGTVREQVGLKAADPYHPISIPRATTIKINSIRDIRRNSSMTSFGGSGTKVFILMDADSMNDDGANALLKTLEEPLGDTILILTASNPDMLLRTIVSRCQQVFFEPLAEEAIREALVKRNGLAADIARLAARLGGGSYTRSLDYASSSLFDRRKEAIGYLRTLLARSRKELLDEIERISAGGDRAAVTELLQLMQDWLREAMRSSQGADVVVPDDEADTLRRFVEHYRGSDYPSAIGAIDRAISLVDGNVYIPLIHCELAARLRTLIRP
jgi:DNA polymerase III subunit delta'